MEELPDERSRRQVLAELQPRSLDYFGEVHPEVPGWPDAPAGYLLFTEGYRPNLEQAQSAGWPNRNVPAGHFHMLADPAGVASVLADLVKEVVEK